MKIAFTAQEYQADGSFQVKDYDFNGSVEQGWTVNCDGQLKLEVGAGYRPLRSQQCGVCSTDLARRFLPFPLPQVLGHEVLALDESGTRQVVEINASHSARGIQTDCAFCNNGLASHCPDRIVLGINALPGGFGPYILAPVNAIIPVPDQISSRAAVLVEPLAAALHALTTIDPQNGDSIAVVGPRKLGMLVLAAARAYRSMRAVDFNIIALARRQEILDVALQIGADEVHLVEGNGKNLPDCLADVVIDTTGTPEGLLLALRLARREIHLKSTHGQAVAGLKHLTQLVVDELAIERFESLDNTSDLKVAWLANKTPPSEFVPGALYKGKATDILAKIESESPGSKLPRVDVAVVDTLEQIDSAIRPQVGREVSLVRPRGTIVLYPNEVFTGSPITKAIMDRGLKLTSSRCGDFRTALSLMAADPGLLEIGNRLITHQFSAEHLTQAFATAASTKCIKAVVEQDL